MGGKFKMSEYFSSYAGPDDIMHRNHKYIEKYKSKSGKWVYIYKKTGKQDTEGVDDSHFVTSVTKSINNETGEVEEKQNHTLWVDTKDNTRTGRQLTGDLIIYPKRSDKVEKQLKDFSTRYGVQGGGVTIRDIRTGKILNESDITRAAKIVTAKNKVKVSVLKAVSNGIDYVNKGKEYITKIANKITLSTKDTSKPTATEQTTSKAATPSSTPASKSTKSSLNQNTSALKQKYEDVRSDYKVSKDAYNTAKTNFDKKAEQIKEAQKELNKAYASNDNNKIKAAAKKKDTLIKQQNEWKQVMTRDINYMNNEAAELKKLDEELAKSKAREEAAKKKNK